MDKYSLYIIGGNGFIGKNLVRFLYTKFKITVIDKFIENKYFESYPAIETLQIDLEHQQVPENYSTPDFIINLVSIVTGDRNIELFDQLINSNLRILLQLYTRFSNKSALKLFVQFGSIEEYGSISIPYDEQMRENPVSPYALVKQLTTNTALMLHRNYHFPIMVVRPGNLFGPFQNSSKFIPYIIEKLIKNENLEITTCNQKREFIYVDDFAFLLEKILLNYKNAIGEIMNVSSGESISLKMIIEHCKLQIGSTSIINYGALKYRESEIMDQTCSIEKLSLLINETIHFNLFNNLNLMIKLKNSDFKQ